MSKIKISSNLYNYVKKNVNLAEYMEIEAGCKLRWYEPNISAGSICPMPHHKDKNPSFRIKFIIEDGIWIYHCLGCGSKGTIIDFCREYHGLKTSADAVKMLCEKYHFNLNDNINTDESLLIKSRKKINFQKKMECAHIVTSNQCRLLLKKNYEKHNKWVATAYKRLNEALDKEDIDTIEMIGFEAFNRMKEKI